MLAETSIRTLIVDQESTARAQIRNLLRGDPEMEIIGDCTSGNDAVKAVREHSPDLVFLDVMMPERDGFEVMEAFDDETRPAFIFVTACDQYAVRAFELSALDYLLKPFERPRFDRAVERAKTQILYRRTAALNRQILSALEGIKSEGSHLERLVIKSNGRIFFIKVEEIDWIEAEGNYVRLHAGKQSYLLRDTLSSLEAQLDQNCFARVHRSAIVNIDRIQELQPWFHGEYRVLLQDGVELTLTRTYRDRLNEHLGLNM